MKVRIACLVVTARSYVSIPNPCTPKIPVAAVDVMCNDWTTDFEDREVAVLVENVVRKIMERFIDVDPSKIEIDARIYTYDIEVKKNEV